MTKKISIKEFSPGLQRQIKQAVAALSKKPSVLLASEEVDIDDQQFVDDFATMDALIRYFTKYLTTSSAKARFIQEVTLIVNTIEKFNLLYGVEEEELEPYVTSITLTSQRDTKGKRKYLLEMSVHIYGDEMAFRGFQQDLSKSLRGKGAFKVCKYQPNLYLGIDEFDGDEDEDIPVSASEGTLGFVISSDVVDDSVNSKTS